MFATPKTFSAPAFGQAIKAARAELGIAQTELAERTTTTQMKPSGDMHPPAA